MIILKYCIIANIIKNIKIIHCFHFNNDIWVEIMRHILLKIFLVIWRAS